MGECQSVWTPPGQNRDETQHLLGQHAQAHAPGTHVPAYPRLLELTPGPNRVPAPSQPNCYGGRVPLPASPPPRNPHPPFSAGQGRIQTPGKRRSTFSGRDAGSRRHSLSARACLFLRGARKRAGQSLLFWHLETGLSIRGWRVWKAIFYLLNVVSLHRAHVNC